MEFNGTYDPSHVTYALEKGRKLNFNMVVDEREINNIKRFSEQNCSVKATSSPSRN